MLRNYLNLLFLSAITLMVSACCKKRLYCDAATLKIALAGFPRNEVRHVLLRKFKVGDTSKTLDSALLSYTANTPIVVNKKDTLWLSDYTSNTAMGNAVRWGNDWKIRLVGPQPRTYTITSIEEEGQRYQLVKCDDQTTRCTNELSEFAINDYPVSGNTVYIQK